MPLFDDRDVILAVLAAYIQPAPPPTRAETIVEAWRLAGDRFDYARGWMVVAHDLDIVEPIRFELIDYADQGTVIEAEGVVVAKFPRIG